jgi:hypothetical protein
MDENMLGTPIELWSILPRYPSQSAFEKAQAMYALSFTELMDLYNSLPEDSGYRLYVGLAIHDRMGKERIKDD